MAYAQIAGWGMCMPARVVTNEDLVKSGVDTSDEWIRTRTGIRQRYMVAQEEATSDLAVRAAQRALRTGDAHPGDVDLIIVATCTPDHVMPATASLVQDRIGATNAGAVDLNAACSGFVYAMTMATGQIESGRARRVLVIGADTLSIYLNRQDRNTSVLFGDGAGALLLQASDEPGVLSTSVGSDGSGAQLLTVPGGGSRLRWSDNGVADGDHYLRMEGPQIFRWATQMMGKAAEKAIRASGLRPDQIDLFIPHQANLRIIEATAKRLGIPHGKVFVNVGRYGNTSAASIPIALCEAVEDGRIKAGANIVLTSFGAGLTWAAAVVRWGKTLPVRAAPWTRIRQLLEDRMAAVGSSLRRQERRARDLLDRPFHKDDL